MSGRFASRFAVAILVAATLGGCGTETRTVLVTDDACAAYGFRVDTPEYRQCQSREANARLQGRVRFGYSEAQTVADAQAACRSYGLAPYSDVYDRCVQREYAARRPI